LNQAGVEEHKYPKAVFFIIGNEFCERFSFFGLRGMLSVKVLQLSGDDHGSFSVHLKAG